MRSEVTPLAAAPGMTRAEAVGRMKALGPWPGLDGAPVTAAAAILAFTVEGQVAARRSALRPVWDPAWDRETEQAWSDCHMVAAWYAVMVFLLRMLRDVDQDAADRAAGRIIRGLEDGTLDGWMPGFAREQGLDPAEIDRLSDAAEWRDTVPGQELLLKGLRGALEDAGIPFTEKTERNGGVTLTADRLLDDMRYRADRPRVRAEFPRVPEGGPDPLVTIWSGKSRVDFRGELPPLPVLLTLVMPMLRDRVGDGPARRGSDAP